MGSNPAYLHNDSFKHTLTPNTRKLSNLGTLLSFSLFSLIFLLLQSPGTHDLLFDHHKSLEELRISAANSCLICQSVLYGVEEPQQTEGNSRRDSAFEQGNAIFPLRAGLSLVQKLNDTYRLDIMSKRDGDKLGTFLLEKACK